MIRKNMGNKTKIGPPVVLVHEAYGFSPSRHLPASYGNHPQATWVPFADWVGGGHQLGSKGISAVLVFISSNLIQDPDYLHFLKTCRQIAEIRPDFRLYLLRYDMGQDELFTEAKKKPELEEIIDTFNISNQTGDALYQEVDRSLDRFLNERNDIVNAESYKNFLRSLFFPFALVSIFLTLASLFSILGILLSFTNDSLVQNKPEAAKLIGFLGGYLFCQLHLIAIARRRNLFLPILWAGTLVAGSIHIPLAWQWIAAGYLLALSLDHLRRRWLDLLPIGLTPDRFPSKKRSGLLSIFGGTLWPKDRAVFISYARRTWADPIVWDLRERFQHHKINCFLDIADIELGSSWRFALEEGIRRCTMFLFFDDGEPHRPLRYWHHAELVTAVSRKSRTGFPDIAVMTLQAEEVRPIATYRIRLSKYFHRQKYRVIPISKANVEEFAKTIALTPVRQFGPAGTANPIVELFMGSFFQSLLKTFFLLAHYIGNMMLSFSLFFAPLLMFLPASTLSRIHFHSSPFYPLAFGLALGFSLRSILHFMYEAVDKSKKTYLYPTAVRFVLVFSVMWIRLKDDPVLFLLVSLLAVLIGFVSLDLQIRNKKRDFEYGMRAVIDKV